DLPSFPHPLQAAYVLGPERGALTRELAARCQHLVRIPSAFSLNVATAGAIVMYDRLRSLGRFGSRPVAAGAEAEPPRPHVQGGPKRVHRRFVLCIISGTVIPDCRKDLISAIFCGVSSSLRPK